MQPYDHCMTTIVMTKRASSSSSSSTTQGFDESAPSRLAAKRLALGCASGSERGDGVVGLQLQPSQCDHGRLRCGNHGERDGVACGSGGGGTKKLVRVPIEKKTSTSEEAASFC